MVVGGILPISDAVIQFVPDEEAEDGEDLPSHPEKIIIAANKKITCEITFLLHIMFSFPFELEFETEVHDPATP
jgi:hypothetical protein